MHVRGTVFQNPKFRFQDGGIGKKLLILLNTPTSDEEYLFVKTTSQEKKRSKTPGCGKHPVYDQGEYFLPKGSAYFDLPTWVIVSEIYPIPQNDVKTDPNWHEQKNSDLPSKTVNGIIDCLLKFKGDDIPEMYEEWLKPSMNDALSKLAEKFNR